MRGEVVSPGAQERSPCILGGSFLVCEAVSAEGVLFAKGGLVILYRENRPTRDGEGSRITIVFLQDGLLSQSWQYHWNHIRY